MRKNMTKTSIVLWAGMLYVSIGILPFLFQKIGVPEPLDTLLGCLAAVVVIVMMPGGKNDRQEIRNDNGEKR